MRSAGTLIISTSAVEVSIHATSPLFGVGAGFASSFFASGAAAGLASAAAFSGVAAGLSCASVTPAKASDSTTAKNAQSVFSSCTSARGRIGLAGADADYLLKVEHEDLAVADLAGVRRFLDRRDRLLEHLGLDRRFDFYLGQKVDDVFRAAIELGVPFLPTEALHFRHGDALHADGRERLAHLVELEGLDDCRYQFHAGLHGAASRGRSVGLRRSCRPKARSSSSRRRSCSLLL